MSRWRAPKPRAVSLNVVQACPPGTVVAELPRMPAKVDPFDAFRWSPIRVLGREEIKALYPDLAPCGLDDPLFVERV